MDFDREEIRSRLTAWGQAMQDHALPAWEDFPALPLYMDQVIFLLNGYLALLPESGREDGPVTPAMINNYVKLKIVPPPEKKRYERVHLAYLVMVCVLKQSMSTGDIKRLLPVGLPQEEIRALYGAFVQTVKAAQIDFCRSMGSEVLPALEADGQPTANLIVRAAVISTLCRQGIGQAISLRRADEGGNDGK